MTSGCGRPWRESRSTATCSSPCSRADRRWGRRCARFAGEASRCDWLGPERACRRAHDGAGGLGGHGPRGGGDGGRRGALRRADAPGIRPRRLLGDPPARARLAVLPRPRAARGVDSAAGRGRSPARRRDGRDDGALVSRDGRTPRRGSRGIHAPPPSGRRPLDAARTGSPRSASALAAGASVKPQHRSEGAFERAIAREAVPHERGPGAPRRPRRALDVAARATAERWRWPDPRRDSPRLRLGVPARRVAATRGRPRRPVTRARRRDPNEQPGGRVTAGRCGPGRCRAA